MRLSIVALHAGETEPKFLFVCLFPDLMLLLMFSSLGTGSTTNRPAFVNHLTDIHIQAEKKRQLSPNPVLGFLWLPVVYSTASAISHRVANTTL